MGGIRPEFDADNPFATRVRPAPTFDADNPFAPKPEETDPIAVKRGQLEVSTKQAHMGNAGEMAEAFVLAQRTKLPVQTVARNLAQVREFAGDKTFEPEQFVKDYPTTADWLTDEANATVSQGDWENLGKMERLLGRWRMPTFEDVSREFGRAGGIQSEGPRGLQTRRGLVQEEWRKGETIIELGELGFLPIDERNRPEVQARIKALQAEQAKQLPDRGMLEQFPRGSAEIAPSMVYSVLEGGKGAAIGAGIFGTLGVAFGPVGVAAGLKTGAAAGAAIGGAVGIWNATAKLEGGNAILAFSELTDEQGNRIDPALADFAGRGVGFVAGSLEAIGIGVILKPFGKAVAPLLRGGVSKALQNQTVRRAFLKGAQVWGTTVGAEVATETAQQGVSLIGEQFARSRSNSLGNTSFDAIPLERVGAELVETAVHTAVGMTLLAVPGGAVTTVSEMAQVAEARDATMRLTALTDVAEASELRKRAPDQFRELIQRDVEENGAVRDISIPVERLEILLQENNVPVDEFVRTVLRDANPYEQAKATGGDVVIPIADYLARVVGTPLHQAMTEDLRLRPGALTAREAGEMQARVETDMEAVREEMAAVVKDVPEEGQRIVEDVRAKLEATGTYTPEQVATMAPTIAAPYVVLAKRAGLDPWQMYSERNVQTFGGQRAEAIFDAVEAVRVAEESGDAAAVTTARATLAGLAGAPNVQSALEQAAFHGTPHTLKGEVRITRADGTVEFHEMGGRLPAEVEAEIQAGTARATDLPAGRFRLDKIGTGEGAQAYGWGLYFAENQGIAEG